jgi:hypothetical protein
MQGYCKESLGPLIPVNYNGYLEAFMQGYSKGSLRPFMLVHYNG